MFKEKVKVLQKENVYQLSFSSWFGLTPAYIYLYDYGYREAYRYERLLRNKVPLYKFDESLSGN